MHIQNLNSAEELRQNEASKLSTDPIDSNNKISSTRGAPEQPTSVNILVINGFDPTIPWSQALIKGLAVAMDKKDTPIQLFVENTYTDIQQSPDFQRNILKGIQTKYRDIQMDAIVSMSVNGFKFAKLIEDEGAFKGVKSILYDTNNQIQYVETPTGPDVKIIYSNLIERQIKQFFVTLPNPQRIFINRAPESLFAPGYNELKLYMAQNLPNTELILIEGNVAQNILDTLPLMTPADMFFYMPVFQNAQDLQVTPKAFLQQISPLANVPIFSFWDTFLGSGIVGGILHSPVKTSSEIVGLTLDILDFGEIQRDPVFETEVYDYELLQRFNLNMPLGNRHKFINPPTSVFEDYPFISLLTVCFFIAVIIFSLFLHNHRLKRSYAQISLANEKMERAREEAISSSRAKSRFLATVSHEIRTPINGIIGALGLIENSALTKDQKQLINVGKYSAESLLLIVNDILDFSKLESEKLILAEEGFSPQRLLNETLQYATIISDTKPIKVIPEFAKLIDVPLLGDKNRLKQILFNLVNNATKFSLRGEITIGAEITSENESYRLTCWINDTGIGISKVDQAELFQPFVQAQDYLHKSQSGTGLGLTICHELIQIMGGTIALSSELNVGTRVTFSVPLPLAEKVHNDVAEELNFTLSELQNCRILLVEDNKINQEITQAQLSEFGIHCEIVDNGYLCIKQLQEIAQSGAKHPSFDIILMDIQMPIMNGYDTAQAIRSGEAGSIHCNIPIIALTAHVALEEQQKALEAGMQRHLNKPIHPKELLNTIYELYSKSISIRP
ncbi:ATP-binding protein [Alteromonas sp. LMIT007]|uniref:histidine kinase n=2 Tax=Opacimonas viscosa TaxID=2961944 RepID=A0AA42BNE5_9ALTE|nr:ATP-binding protein [Opacimonas viscosa]